MSVCLVLIFYLFATMMLAMGLSHVTFMFRYVPSIPCTFC